MFSNTTLVFRVEDFEGVGMYQAPGTNMTTIAYDDDSVDNVTVHPTPEHDTVLENTLFKGCNPDQVCKILDRMEPYNFGFASVEQLLDWLFRDEWLEELDRVGFRVTVYAADAATTYHGAEQSAFIKRTATLQKQVPLTSLKRNEETHHVA